MQDVRSDPCLGARACFAIVWLFGAQQNHPGPQTQQQGPIRVGLRVQRQRGKTFAILSIGRCPMNKLLQSENTVGGYRLRNGTVIWNIMGFSIF